MLSYEFSMGFFDPPLSEIKTGIEITYVGVMTRFSILDTNTFFESDILMIGETGLVPSTPLGNGLRTTLLRSIDVQE